MNANLDEEKTLYEGYGEDDKEETLFDEKQPSGVETVEDASKDEPRSEKGKSWKKAAIGAGTGLLIGGVSTMLMGMKSAGSETGSGDADGDKDKLSHPEWVDDQINVATTVNDNMSFGEAFAAARAEVGAGGCFEWHGQLYGTYTADEWNGMTAAQRAEYGNHFSWNHIDHTGSVVAQHGTHHNSASSGTHQNHSTDLHAQHDVASDDDIDVISVDHNNGQDSLAQNGHEGSSVSPGSVYAALHDPEVEILGVVHDSEANVNIGGMRIDGQEVILIDVDNDLTFDYMAMDHNHNGQLEQEECVNIEGQGYTVADLGGLPSATPGADMGGDLIASNDAPDYLDDMSMYDA